jgi:hypothetical protein
MFNQTVDMGLKSALRRAGAIQDFDSKQMWSNEKVLQESRAAEYDFWGKMVFPGGGGGGGSKYQQQNQNITSSGTRGINDNYGMYSSSFGGQYGWGGAQQGF